MPDPAGLAATEPDPLLALIHEGWDHLKRQRPLAAWACWQRALRIEPEHKAASRALHILANAPDLPEVARAEYRFMAASRPEQTARWDLELRSRDLSDLRHAAAAFGRLGQEDGSLPTAGDGRAWFNQGLCLAWLGENAAALEALDRATQAAGDDDRDAAVTAWALAEVIRQGAGAERSADDLNHVATLHWAESTNLSRFDPASFLDDHPDIRPVASPVDPATGQPTRPDLRLYDWLDPDDSSTGAGRPVRRLRATVIRSSATLRLSGTDPVRLEEAVSEAIRRAGPGRLDSVRREATPLPLAFLDAAVWAVRLQPGLDSDEVDQLNRSVVEHYYEEVWINRPRIGLEGHAPHEAARLGLAGNHILLIKLYAVVRVREQLGQRPSTAALYGGYPFDRLRRRLGLVVANPETIDPEDPTSMSAADLDRLDLAQLPAPKLADAFRSAAALGDDARTTRFAAALADGDPETGGLGLITSLTEVFAPLVRRALAADNPELALRWIDRALEIDDQQRSRRHTRELTTWRAEVLARTGQADAAFEVYRRLLAADPDPEIALDAAETMLDNAHDDQARILARLALDAAHDGTDPTVIDRAEAIL